VVKRFPLNSACHQRFFEHRSLGFEKVPLVSRTACLPIADTSSQLENKKKQNTWFREAKRRGKEEEKNKIKVCCVQFCKKKIVIFSVARVTLALFGWARYQENQHFSQNSIHIDMSEFYDFKSLGAFNLTEADVELVSHVLDPSSAQTKRFAWFGDAFLHRSPLDSESQQFNRRTS
jgi:hypothetical protein